VLAAGAGLLLAGCGGSEAVPTSTQDEEAPTPGDLEILAYALTLEYFEADFYDRLVGEALLDSDDQDTAKLIAEHEAEHVDALETSLEELGGRRPVRPKPDLGVLLAGGPEAVLVRAADIENLVAAAYLGQVPRIRSEKVLASTLTIHAVEARHAAALNRRVGRSFVPDGAVAAALTFAEVQAKLERFLL
jgi:rubrerythrin